VDRVIVNFNKKFYTPVQSRTNIKFKETTLEDVRLFLSNGTYMAIAYMYSKSELISSNDVLDHTTSNARIYQLKLPVNYSYNTGDLVTGDVTGILAYYTIPIRLLPELNRLYHYTGGKDVSMADFIDHIIDQKSTGKFENPTPSDNILQKVIEVWFTGKDETKSKEEHIIIVDAQKHEQKSEKQVKPPVDVSHITIVIKFEKLQQFVNVYWDTVQTLIKKGIIRGINSSRKPAPLIGVGHSINKLSGFYDTKTHEILIDIDLKVYEAKIDELKLTSNVELIRTDPVLSNLFSPNSPTPTLIHELLHVVLNDSHIGSAHPRVLFEINGVSHDDIYDIAALEIYKILLEHNLISNWMQTI
jgi:hypothetical protein